MENTPCTGCEEETDENVSVILSAKDKIPINCMHCQQQMAVRLHTLKQSKMVVCEHCHTAQPVSQSDLIIIHALLARAGYHFSLD